MSLNRQWVLFIFIVAGFQVTTGAWAVDSTNCSISPQKTNIATLQSYNASVASWLDHIQKEKTQDPPVKAGETSFILPDPTKPGYKAAPTRRVVVLVHGLSDSPATMKDLAQTYVKQGYTVLGVRLSGHGTINKDGSDNLADFRINGTRANWENDVAQAVKVAQGLGDEVSLTGYSTGGALSVNYALKDRLGQESVHVHDVNLIAPMIGLHNDLAPLEAEYSKHVEDSKLFGGKKVALKNVQVQNLYSYAANPAEVIVQAVNLIDENIGLIHKAEVDNLVHAIGSEVGIGKKNNTQLIPVNVILGSADTTINNADAALFTQNAGYYGLSIQPPTLIQTTTAHSLFTMKNLLTPVHPKDAPINPAFPKIVASTMSFIEKTGGGDLPLCEAKTNTISWQPQGRSSAACEGKADSFFKSVNACQNQKMECESIGPHQCKCSTTSDYCQLASNNQCPDGSKPISSTGISICVSKSQDPTHQTPVTRVLSGDPR